MIIKCVKIYITLTIINWLFITTKSQSSSMNLGCNFGYYQDTSGNCVKCPENTYGPASNLQQCLPCPQYSGTANKTGSNTVSDCLCDAGYYRLEETNICIKCPADKSRYICPGPYVKNYCETHNIANEGWWIQSTLSGIYQKCPIKTACKSKCAGCTTGYTGPLCNTCDFSHFKFQFGLDSFCIKCPNSGEIIAILISIYAILLTICYATSTSLCFIYYSMINDRLTMPNFFIIYLNIMILLAQNIWFPISLFPSKCITHLIPSEMLSINEIGTTDAKSNLTLAIVIPIMGITLLFIFFTFKHIIDIARIYKKSNCQVDLQSGEFIDSSIRLDNFNKALKNQMVKTTYRFISSSQIFLYLIYSPITWVFLKSLKCINIPSYGNVTEEDYVLSCGALKNSSAAGLTYFSVFFPLINIINGIIFRRKIIHKEELYYISNEFLFSGYHPLVQFWESIRLYVLFGTIGVMNLTYATSHDLLVFCLTILACVTFIETLIPPINNKDSVAPYAIIKPWWILSLSSLTVSRFVAFSLVTSLCLFGIYGYFPKAGFIISIAIVVLELMTIVFLFYQVSIDLILLAYKYRKYKRIYGENEQFIDTVEEKDGFLLYYQHNLGEEEQDFFISGLLRSPFPDEAAAQMIYLVEHGNLFDCDTKEVGKCLFSAGFFEPQGQTLRFLIPRIKYYRENPDIPVNSEVELLDEVRKVLMNAVKKLGIEVYVKDSQYRANGARIAFCTQQVGPSVLLQTSDYLYNFLSKSRISNILEVKLRQSQFRLLFPDAIPMVYPDDEEFRLRIIDARRIARQIYSERRKREAVLKSENLYDKYFGFHSPMLPDNKEILAIRKLNELIAPPRWDPLDGRLDREFDYDRYCKIRGQFEDILSLNKELSDIDTKEKNSRFYKDQYHFLVSKRYNAAYMVGDKYVINGDSEVHDIVYQTNNKSITLRNSTPVKKIKYGDKQDQDHK
ncbi:uncharacterized protein CMU_012150 [Cryptosporidium muris RN66]|uniref:Tyrosine-protein kinase ephrin type A/B receptor-like domain-containing protein n=1 Tax=Cryptosporidium muris (strain RN66) TaxID=441375 RepID=B6AEC4_CRYMR|nr:uncharacterized protein CMU_012150 [Cryptosporidium muris RN66]EEA06541.1 hypothetical protein, conserved [Cryptosporidium muris RN66]|eukprot:XP_002140890.1 hypothetical protein [Cryptosporidium muris RN66]